MLRYLLLSITMFYSVGSTQSLVHAERHLSGFVPTLIGISHHVKVQGNLSQILNLNCSVPQGSCPWPLLFTTHASNLFDVNLPTVHSYVDNMQLYVSLTSRKNTGQFKVSVRENEVPTEKNSCRASIFATKASYISN